MRWTVAVIFWGACFLPFNCQRSAFDSPSFASALRFAALSLPTLRAQRCKGVTLNAAMGSQEGP